MSASPMLDFISDIQSSRLPEAVNKFLALQGYILQTLQDIKTILQPQPKTPPLPIDFEVVVGTSSGQGYVTNVNLTLRKILVACDTQTTVTLYVGENNTWLSAYPILANTWYTLNLEDDLGRMIGRGIRIQATFASGNGKCHIWAKTS